MGERDAAQAVMLVRALCDLLDQMTSRLTRLEHYGSHREAAALRRDMYDAQTHINRLQRRYLSTDDGHAAARQLAQYGRNGQRLVMR